MAFEPRIVAAVGTAVGLQDEQTPLTVALQAAMVKAIEDALAEGVSIENSEELLKRKAEARRAVLESWGQ